VLVLCCVAIASAQERVIEKAVFDVLVTEGSNHPIRWKGEKYRMTVTTSSKAVGRPQTDWSSKMVVEYGPAKAIRTVTTSAFGGNANPTNESLRLGDWVYVRTGSGPWTRKENVPAASAKEKEEDSLKTLRSQAEYKYLGQERLTDIRVDVYVKTERQTKYNQKNGDNLETNTNTPTGSTQKEQSRSTNSSPKHSVRVLLW
jgi:hypothetical protein